MDPRPAVVATSHRAVVVSCRSAVVVSCPREVVSCPREVVSCPREVVSCPRVVVVSCPREVVSCPRAVVVSCHPEVVSCHRDEVLMLPRREGMRAQGDAEESDVIPQNGMLYSSRLRVNFMRLPLSNAQFYSFAHHTQSSAAALRIILISP
ncbi:hypothetical protein GCM10010435_06290 [Winogradskya consettensis]|uniref:Uncharacterized protein n=1 Tax=Winogradskya consettensis TaxID=113560 RepID=A0A919SQB1_9ACTN|nr:hypothetical protein Aco04nite_47950 [Actinoplanes consettensis]